MPIINNLLGYLLLSLASITNFSQLTLYLTNQVETFFKNTNKRKISTDKICGMSIF